MFNPKVKEGDRIVCIQMQGESDNVPVGTKGTVQRIVKTPFGDQIEVNWENGSKLSLLMDEDVWMLEDGLKKKKIKEDFEVEPSERTVKSICDAKKFCEAQGPITFGQLREIVETAMSKRIALHVGEGSYKAFLRLLPWFIPQIAVGGFLGAGLRAANKVFRPTLYGTKNYKTWWGKTILNIFNLAEGELNPTDPFSKIFFISDGLMNLMDEENKVKFAMYIAEIASEMPDNQEVPEMFVENELRSWINKKFLLDPPLGPKEPKKEVDNDVIKEDLKRLVMKKLNYIVE
jgi:Domain of unknown function (DUF4314)